MLNLFNRKPKNQIDISKLSPEQLVALVEAGHLTVPAQPLGDGKAVWLDDGFEEEALELKREEEGSKPWYDRIRRL